jgi:hypothetical protein
MIERPDGSPREYENKVREARHSHHLTVDDYVLFLEVREPDALRRPRVHVG